MNLRMRTLQSTEVAGNDGLTLRVQQLLERTQCPFTGSRFGSWCGRHGHARCAPVPGKPSI
jgi:hypothetical protein